LLKKRLEEVDANIQKLLSNDPDMTRTSDILCSIPGISKARADSFHTVSLS
jgi:hypothetical protein